MSAPRLNRALVLETRDIIADGAGGQHSTWSALGTVWASIRSLTGRETGSLGIAQSKVGLKITLRAAPHASTLRPRPDQRFREGARIYRITAVAEAEPAGRYLVCYASEEVAA
ncbi:MAG: phage head closure protein [Planktotalea sp.]|uniref:phage head closure protein n=1 Tax=Planktotalea sp. TaxID=2029877 RepID=UPI003C720240